MVNLYLSNFLNYFKELSSCYEGKEIELNKYDRFLYSAWVYSIIIQ
jgi:hypothetical protein